LRQSRPVNNYRRGRRKKRADITRLINRRFGGALRAFEQENNGGRWLTTPKKNCGFTARPKLLEEQPTAQEVKVDTQSGAQQLLEASAEKSGRPG